MKKDILSQLRFHLEELADSDRAPGMQRYMKSEMPFYGIPTLERRKVSHKVFKKYAPLDFNSWREALLHIWRNAEYREEWYCVIDLVGWKPCTDHHIWESLPVFEECIVDGAWWDICDQFARPLGNILKWDPERMRGRMLEWAEDDDIWRRRSAILCQLHFKNDLDFDFLQKCIEPSIGSDEFFLRKGIGWALRDYAWTNPLEVKAYVEKNEERLSPLSKREALKHIHKLIGDL